MCQSNHSKTHTLILAALLTLVISTLTACGQRGPLKLPERLPEPPPNTKPSPQESPAK